MDTKERMVRAARIAENQKLRSKVALDTPEPLPALSDHIEKPKAAGKWESTITEVLIVYQKSGTSHKIWMWICALLWVLLVIPTLVASPLGGIILLPLLVAAFVILIGLPFWLTAAFRPSSQKPRGNAF